jgi:hypothetical protein
MVSLRFPKFFAFGVLDRMVAGQDFQCRSGGLQVRAGPKKWIGALAFVWTALKVASHLHPQQARIVCD